MRKIITLLFLRPSHWIALLTMISLILLISISSIRREEYLKGRVSTLEVSLNAINNDNSKMREELKKCKLEIDNKNVSIQYKELKDGKYEVLFIDKNNGMTVFDSSREIAFQRLNMKSAEGKVVVLNRE